MKRVILFFYYQQIYKWTKNDGICVLCRRKNFIGKIVKSCSVLSKDAHIKKNSKKINVYIC